MPRPYLVGWKYAFEAYFRTFKRTKASRSMWIKLVKKGYYWLTTEERVEANKKCFGAISELGKNMFPNGISKDDYRYSYNCDEDDNDITEEEREILLQYRKDKKEGKVETVPLRKI